MAVVVRPLDEITQEAVDLGVCVQEMVVIENDDEMLRYIVKNLIGQHRDEKFEVDIFCRG